MDSPFLQLVLVENTRDNWDSVVEGETESHFPVPACDVIGYQAGLHTTVLCFVDVLNFPLGYWKCPSVSPEGHGDSGEGAMEEEDNYAGSQDSVFSPLHTLPLIPRIPSHQRPFLSVPQRLVEARATASEDTEGITLHPQVRSSTVTQPPSH